VDVVAVKYFKNPNFVVRIGAGRVVSGRNVGKSTMLQAGLLYTFEF
jgi:hypothetical protein